MPPTVPTRVLRLATDLAGRADATLADQLSRLLASSPRFVVFAEAHRDKIRKKLRTAGDEEARRDVLAELEVARALLRDRRVDLGFEVAGATRGGPDFAVAFRDHPAFNLEVTRPRNAAQPGGLSGPILAKVRQLPTGAPNVVLLVVSGVPPDGRTLDDAVGTLRRIADAKDESYFTRRGYGGTRDFYDRFLRLGGVLAWAPGHAGVVTTWSNPSARHAVATPALRACASALEAAQ